MKRKIYLIICAFCILFITGCVKTNEKNIVKKIKNKIEENDSYYLNGELEINNAESTYKYEVESSYKKNDLYRVKLKNKNNNHEQIILKNKEGVYVLTPSLNKSFKFQSDWPYNNSQSYLLQTLIKDMEKEDTKYTKDKNEYIFTTKAEYSNNKDLKYQKIYIDKNLDVKKVEIYDEKDNLKMKMIFNNIKYGENFSENYFELKNNMSISNEEIEESKTTSKISDIVYPMYLPNNTYLTGQNKVNTDNGERVILTFTGEKPFTFVQENTHYEKELNTINMTGEPIILTDTIGAITDNSASWISNNMEYYIISDSLSSEELVSVVQSISVMPVSK